MLKLLHAIKGSFQVLHHQIPVVTNSRESSVCPSYGAHSKTHIQHSQNFSVLWTLKSLDCLKGSPHPPIKKVQTVGP